MSCFDCKLATCRTKLVSNVVIANCDICFVAEAPGADEDVQGYPLVGRSGKVFNAALTAAGINRMECSVCNVVRCRPPNNRTPAKDEIKACYPHLDADIAIAKPKIIVPMGATALARIMGKKHAITKVCGTVLESKLYPGVKIVPAIHPAAVLRDPGYQSKLDNPLKLAQSVLSGGYGVLKDTGNYIHVTSKYVALQMLGSIATYPAFAFDIEFDSPNFRPINGKILCCSFSVVPGHGWWIEWDNLVAWCGDFLKALMSGSKVKIVHNSLCELKWLRYFGFPMSLPVYDTMMSEYLTDESEKAYSTDSTSLKKLALRYTDMGDYAHDIVSTFDEGGVKAVEPEKLGKYCAQDSDATFRIYQVQQGRLESDGMLPLYNNLLMPGAELLSRVELVGALIDQQVVAQVKEDLTTKIEDAKAKMEVWLKGRNPRSSDQLAAALIESGVVLTKETEKSQAKRREDPNHPPKYCLDKEVLEELSAKYAWVRSLIEHRKYDKLRSTYTDALLEKLDKDGRCRTSYSLCFTDTGRLASRDPNLQNIPKDKTMRSMFVAPPGYKIVQADASQAELRWGAVHTGDPTLIRLLSDPTVDIHTSVASEVFGLPLDKITSELRSKIKPVNFGIFYGATAARIAVQAGIPLDEADALIRTWYERFHFVKEWKDRVVQDARLTGWVESKFGRRRRLPGLNSTDNFVRTSAERQCVNAPIQADASDMTLLGSLRVDAAIRDSGLLKDDPLYCQYQCAEFMTVHDSVMYYIPDALVDKFIGMARPILEDFPIKVVPMVFDFEVGDRWGALTKVGRKEVKMAAA